MDILQTLQSLNQCHGPSGDEGEIRVRLQELAAPLADELTVDAMGNLIAHRRGRGPKVMFAAHMDSIGMIVTYIESEGYLRFGRIGGLRPYSLLHTPVRFRNGVRGIVAADEGADEKKLTLDDLYLDIGAKDREEAQKLVQIGDTAVVDSPVFSDGGRIVSPYLDNRISCIAMLMGMERLEGEGNDLYFVFTTQEELGLRGVKTAAYSIAPDYGIALDVTTSGDELGSKHSGSSILGGGAAVKVMDQSVICHPQVVSQLEQLARQRGIHVQRDIIKGGGTDAGAIHTSRGGVLTGGISIPCRYIHSPVEMADCGDVEACAALIAAFAGAKLL